MGKFEEITETLVIHKIKTSWLLIEKFYNEEATRNDVSLSMAFVLMAINNEKGSTVTSIAPRIGMEPNSLSRTLKKLIEKQYIYKKKSSKDKRKVYVCLTTEGLKMQKIAVDKMFALELKIKSSFTEQDLNSFFKVMSSITIGIEALKK